MAGLPKQAKRLVLQFDLDAGFAQLARFQVELKDAELNDIAERTGRIHDRQEAMRTVPTKKRESTSCTGSLADSAHCQVARTAIRLSYFLWCDRLLRERSSLGKGHLYILGRIYIWLLPENVLRIAVVGCSNKLRQL